MPTCPSCEGYGKLTAICCGRPGCRHVSTECRTCRGAGEITDQQLDWRNRGLAARIARIRRGETLSETARRLGISAADVSKMSEGLLDPAPLEALDA